MIAVAAYNEFISEQDQWLLVCKFLAFTAFVCFLAVRTK